MRSLSFAHNATYNTILILRDLKTTWHEKEAEESFWFMDIWSQSVNLILKESIPEIMKDPFPAPCIILAGSQIVYMTCHVSKKVVA